MHLAGNGREPAALLTAADEVRLAVDMEAGVLAAEALRTGRCPVAASTAELALLVERGERARQHYIEANLRLVAMVSSQLAGRSGLPEADLFQEGCLGLIDAVARFDWRRGCRFSTYALFWIRAYVTGATARALGALNLPTTRAAQLRAARGVEGALSQSLGRPASAAEVATALSRSEQWTAELLAHVPPQPIDALADEVVLVTVDDGLDAVLDRDRPGAELLEHLPRVERRVLERRLGFAGGSPSGYAETARALGLSVTQVRRAERRALDRLRAVCPYDARVHL